MVEYRSALPERAEGTCDWVLKSPQFDSWVRDEGFNLLWISGHPGSGKTVLSSYLSQKLTTKGIATTRAPLVCYFFCNDGIEDQRDARAILRSIIFQILLKRRDLIKHVKPLIRYDKSGTALLKSYDTLWSLFSTILDDPFLSSISIIIDALDECEKSGRKRLMESLTKFTNMMKLGSNRCIRFLITSRPYLALTDCFTDSHKLRRLSLEDQHEVDADIRLFIRQRVQQIGRWIKAKQDTISLLERSLNENADRTFLWAKFALHLLDENLLSAPGDFERIHAELPRDLEDTYKRFLARIQSTHEAFAVDLLRMILASYRPLSLEEINIAITMQDITPSNHGNLGGLQEILRRDMRGDIHKVLGPLVRISESRVYLVHLSLREFLCKTLCRSSNEALAKRYSIDIDLSHKSLASSCIGYLSLSDFAEDWYALSRTDTDGSSLASSGDPEIDHIDLETLDDNLAIFDLLQDVDEIDAKTCTALGQRYPFFEYSSVYWARHFCQSQENLPSNLQELAWDLCDKGKSRLANWFRTFWIWSGTTSQYPDNPDRLFVASFFDHFTVIQRILSGGRSEYQQSLGDALYWASRNGCYRSVTRHLPMDVQPNEKRIENQNALTVAAEMGHSDVVSALAADARVDVNYKGRSQRTPLSLAGGNRHPEVVDILLQHKGIQPDAADNAMSTPLFWAIGRSDVKITRRLASDYRVDVNHVDKYGRTPIVEAVEAGDENIFAILLEIPSVNVDRPDNEGCTPLCSAAKYGSVAIIRKLKHDKRLDLTHSHKDSKGRNAIAWAATNGHDAVVKQLVKYKLPGIDEEDQSNWTPLFWALEAPRSSTVATILNTGLVDVNHKDHGGHTALFGNEDIMRILLGSKEIDVQSPDDRGRTPFEQASKLGKQGIARMLQEHLSKLNPNAKEQSRA
ncbi:hypothetical protein MMC21_000360 [Puttea exsequens]|nr:hypothetical protein [Puttea exsequens]